MHVTYVDDEFEFHSVDFTDPQCAWEYAQAVSELNGCATIRGEYGRHLAEFYDGECLDITHERFIQANT